MNCNNLCVDLPKPACYEVFNDTDTSGYTVDFADGVVAIGDSDIAYGNIGRGFRKPALICPQTAVAQIDWLTPILQNCCDADGNAVFAFTVSWTDDCGRDYSRTYSATLCCTDLTVADITAALTVKVNADTHAIVTATDGTTKLILTADTAGQAFKVSARTTHWTVVVNTANSIAFGDPQYFIDKWNLSSDEFDMTGTYSLLIVKYWETTPDTANAHGGAVNGGFLNSVIWKECYYIIQTGGAAEDDVLGDADKICDIFSGNFSDVTAYLAVTSETCPCA